MLRPLVAATVLAAFVLLYEDVVGVTAAAGCRTKIRLQGFFCVVVQRSLEFDNEAVVEVKATIGEMQLDVLQGDDGEVVAHMQAQSMRGIVSWPAPSGRMAIRSLSAQPPTMQTSVSRSLIATKSSAAL